MKISVEELQLLVPELTGENIRVLVTHLPTNRVYEGTGFSTTDAGIRSAVAALIAELVEEAGITDMPEWLLFDEVRTTPPRSPRSGHVRQIIRHFKNGEWNFYLECNGKHIGTRYVGSDLVRAREA